MQIIALDGFALNPGDLSWDAFKELGDLTVYDRTPPEKTADRIGDAELILVNKTIISRNVIDACPRLRYIGVLATGCNVVDLSAAKKRGVTVANVPRYGTPSVCQHVFALLLELCNHTQAHCDSVYAGEWSAAKDFCYWKFPIIELSGKTLGIFGFGSIGAAVAKSAQSFGMNVICATRTPAKIASGSGVTAVSMDELLKNSDVISIHAPLNAETQNLFNEETIKKTKNGVIIINTARGPIVNEEAMRAALESGKVAAYAADVVSSEPIAKDNPLLKAPNCLLTPHIAWASLEARSRLMQIAAKNLAAFLNGAPINTVE